MTWEAECDVNAEKGETLEISLASEGRMKKKTFQALVMEFFQQAKKTWILVVLWSEVVVSMSQHVF